MKIQIFISQEDGYFIAYCPALDLSGYGKTKQEAMASFDQNREIFLEDTTEKGTLDKILLNLGWTIRKIPKAQYYPPN